MAEWIMGKIFGMTLAGSVMILAVLVLRQLMKKMPARYFCILWMLVLVRLLWPFMPEAPFSLMPVSATALVSAETGPGKQETTLLNTGIRAVDTRVNVILLDAAEKSPGLDPASAAADGLLFIWVLGAAALGGFHLRQYLKLRRMLKTAVPGEPGVRYSEQTDMPFAAGIVKPVIYLPAKYLKEENSVEKKMILTHEQVHIQRKDQILKAAAFLALLVHWFNPLAWVMFSVLSRDMEMACDEQVMRCLGESQKKEYVMALLNFSAGRSGIFLPAGFGEGHTRQRIRHILKYRKPGPWIWIPALILMAGAAAVLLTDSPDQGKISGAVPGTEEASIGIIGGADGPTSIFIAGKQNGQEGEQGAAQAASLDLSRAAEIPAGGSAALDYVSAGKAAFHGGFGYISFSLSADGNGGYLAENVRGAEFPDAGPIIMEGEEKTVFLANESGTAIIHGLYQTEGEKRLYIYMEEDNTIRDGGKLPEPIPEEMAETLKKSSGAAVEEELAARLEKQAESSGFRLLYGPSEIRGGEEGTYGFLAADGDMLGDIWYGIWNPETGSSEKILLFED